MPGYCWDVVGKASLRWADEEADGDDPAHDAGSVKGAGKSSKKKQAKQATKKKQASKAKANQVTVAGAKANKGPGKQHGAYIAGDYSARRRTWIQKRKDKFAMSHRDACSAWNSSKTRARLLEDMPHAEKVRRRFV